MSKNPIPDIKDWITRAIEFFTTDIWRARLEDLPFGKSFLIKQLRVIIITLRRFDEDKCFLRASSLTFYTLLSIVPVAAMLFGVAKGFGFERMFRKELLEGFPGEAQQEVMTKVIEFAESMLEATKGGLIAGIGLIVLFWSVIKVLGYIETSLNDIWEIKENRTWGRKFSDYLAVMVISPLLIIVSSSATVFITSQITQLTNQIKLLGMISPLIFLSFKLIPYVLIWILFSVIYILMPNTKVNLKAGIVSGIIAGTIFQIVQWAYISFQVGTAKYNAIYGSFAALPLFLFWVQISWWVVLLGAELSFAIQNVGTYEYKLDSSKISHTFKKLLTLRVAHLLIGNFARCETPLTDSQISMRLEMPIRLLHQILHDLVESGLFIETRTKDDSTFGYQPACDIKKLTINSIVEAIEHHGTEGIPIAQTEELTALSDSLKQFSHEMENSPANKLLKDI
ncbi:MAG: YihY/virulence factor BrkB family protein [Desulfobacteraceae bacterium]|nr:YihY/virulence factor BrkB family protein [Desulfobacteraceae bacterium]